MTSFEICRTFAASPTQSGCGTHLHIGQESAGLKGLLSGKSIPDLQPSFEPFADGLRRRAEGVVG